MTADTDRTATPSRHPWPAETLSAVAARERPDDPELGRLAELYFADVPAEELPSTPGAALEAVHAHRSLARLRVPGRPVTAVLGGQGSTPIGGEAPLPGRISVLVVTEDMPYLVGSVLAELARGGLTVHRVVHPVVVVRRDVRGELLAFLPDAEPAAPPPGAIAESWMNLELGDLPGSDPARDLAADLHTRLSSVLGDVREVVEDTDRMITMATGVADGLDHTGGDGVGQAPGGTADLADATALLRWFARGHLTFLGYRRQEVVETPEGPALRGVLATGLGVLRRDSLVARGLTASPDAVAPAGTEADERHRARLVLTRASARSTVYQRVHPLYVGVSILDEQGRLVGEHRFLGVLSVAARHVDVLEVPLVARRVRQVVETTGLPRGSWSGQRLLEILQTYPREELLCTDRASLQQTATGVLALTESRRLRLFLRRDHYGRYFSCMIFLPRDRYTTTARLAMQDVLTRALAGTDIEYTARVTEDQLALLHVAVYTGRVEPVVPDVEAITRELAEAARTWADRLREQAVSAGRTPLGGTSPFGPAYQEDFDPARGVADLQVLEGLTGPDDIAVRLHRPAVVDDGSGDRRLTLYLATRVTLSSVLPALQSLGVEVIDERPYEVRRADGTTCWINDFGLRVAEGPTGADADEEGLHDRMAEAFRAVWRGRVGADGFNTLVLRAGMTWRQAAVLRAVSRYLRQIGSPYGQSYITDVVVAHTEVARGLVRLFETRFDPALDPAARSAAVEEIDRDVESAVDAVTGLDADRILRAVLGVLRAMLRTNYFRRDAAGESREFLAFKLDPERVPGVPEPRPAVETFVHSARVEGVHLRYGEIARGGLRWSDRLQDYRTEILGLVKAQAVKNAVIVPVGAKGGFVVKRPPAPTGDPAADREAQRAEGVACYRMFISGLLDLVDDRAGHAARSAILVPDSTVRYDGDDSYLVVAADKGTATFSDVANAVADEYGFWLGDAFASGGSVGYDHKAMGITARGAWESVRRHFRELGRDVSTDEITVVGVGDMSGDVFGNGMLLSEHLRIVAAFDHRHVFLDPDPDPAASFAARQRLFARTRSSWADYDTTTISAGGGVWPRTTKSIPVSGPAAAALGIDPGDIDPVSLVRAILQAPVDLLWNGGIGTYVKASDETHADAGDKGNDAVRVDADRLRVAVVGEGGNLGLTQRGRIQYALAGGKVNTDAVDNSAGVDCSDHEVNIKILLGSLVERGELAPDERDEQIAATTDEVARLVLADNVAQNEVLGVARSHAAAMAHVHASLVADLEARGRLDRELEVLPDAEGFEERFAAGEGLSSPELCTLMAHVKLDLTDALVATDLPDAEVFARRLPAYFPRVLRERYGPAIAQHPLRREIATTLLSNTVVDGGGLTYVHRLAQEVSASPSDAVRAYHVVIGVFGIDDLTADIAAAGMPAGAADRLTLETRRLLDRASRWFLTHRPQPLAVGAEIARFGPWVSRLARQVPDLLRGADAEGAAHTAALVSDGAPPELARRAVGALNAFGLLDVVEIAEIAEQEQGGIRVDDDTVTSDELLDVAELYFALSDHLGLHTLLTAVASLGRADRWDALARLSLRDELYASWRAVTLDVLADTGPEEDADEKIAHWEQANASRLVRARTALSEIAQSGRGDLATVSVAARQIRSMVR